jgi:predicted  nucleic acid-binding Zn-ribbon protein
MKNTIKRILAFVLVIACVVPFVACAKPQLNLEKAEANLKEADYTVTVKEDPSTGVEVMLVAVKDVLSKDAKGVTIMKFETVKLAKLYYQAKVMETEQEIEQLELRIKTIKHMLNKFEDELSSDEIDSYNDSIKEAKAEIEELKEDLKTTGRSGKYVWEGDKDSIKASR